MPASLLRVVARIKAKPDKKGIWLNGEVTTWSAESCSGITESLKKGLLASLPLTAESKAKLEKF